LASSSDLTKVDGSSITRDVVDEKIKHPGELYKKGQEPEAVV
jgi:hypothetical protein